MQNHYHELRVCNLKHSSIDQLLIKGLNRQKCVINQQTQAKLTEIIKLITHNYLDQKTKHKAGDVTTHKTIIIKINKIMPDSFFGCFSNRKLFNGIIKKILTSARFERIPQTTITSKIRIDSIGWLNEIGDSNLKKKIVYKISFHILNFIIKPFIWHCFKPIKTLTNHKIEFVSRPIWQSYEDTAFDELIKLKYLYKAAGPSRGDLLIVKKTNFTELNYRPILNRTRIAKLERKYNSRGQKQPTENQQISKKILKEVRARFTPFVSLYAAWKEYCSSVKNDQVYGVTLDLKDAYGNIKIPELITCIEQLQTLSAAEKSKVVEHISRQFVTFRHTEYRWMHGLLQGDELSSNLCELYISSKEQAYLGLFHTKKCFIHRTVDDYLFCSTNPDDVTDFIGTIKSMHLINESKTQSNLKSITRLSYCGYYIILDRKEIETHFRISEIDSFIYKFKIFDGFRTENENTRDFLNKIVLPSHSRYHLTPILLNTHFNSPIAVLKNVYHSLTFVAFKIDAAIMTRARNQLSYFAKSLEDIVKRFSKVIMDLVYKNMGDLFNKVLNFKVITAVIYNAFYNVFTKRSKTYKSVLIKIGAREKKFFVANFPDIKYFRVVPKAFQHLKMKRCIHNSS